MMLGMSGFSLAASGGNAVKSSRHDPPNSIYCGPTGLREEFTIAPVFPFPGHASGLSGLNSPNALAASQITAAGGVIAANCTGQSSQMSTVDSSDENR